MRFDAESDVAGRIYGEKRTPREAGAAAPRPLHWVGKRLLVLALASGSTGYAFHLFGTWPLGIVAVVTPVFGWIALVLAMQRQFGVKRRRRKAFLEDQTSAQRIRQRETDLAAQMDWKRRFGT